MTIDDLDRALRLQTRAYQLLLWLGNEAKSFPELLDAEAFSSASSTERWVKRHLNLFPSDIRPHLEQIDGVAFALSSFLATSFRIEIVSAGERKVARLVRGAKKFDDRRNKKYAIRRSQDAATELKKLALKSLSAEVQAANEKCSVDAVLSDATLAPALTLWAYGCELVRRFQYASQGPAVHMLWLELTEKERKNLSAERIWKARLQLIEALMKHSVSE